VEGVAELIRTDDLNSGETVGAMEDARLIRRLQERIRVEPTVDMEVCPPIRPNPPVSEEAMQVAEAQLGFSLPPLVRTLYTEVGDGGFGPGYGVIRLSGYEGSLVESRMRMNRLNGAELNDPRDLWWPERLVELVNWGCGYFSGIDCSRPSCPVVFYDNDRAVSGARLVDSLLSEADSLAEWLTAWLEGVDLWT
jgi:hypothetical protein